MPHGRKSALKRNKAGGGFGKSLMKKGAVAEARGLNYQKPDIARIYGEEVHNVKVNLETFLTRDQRVTALETDDYEDFVQTSLFKKCSDLVICNRSGRNVEARTGAEVQLFRKVGIEECKTASLHHIELPKRPFVFRDQQTRITHFFESIGGAEIVEMSDNNLSIRLKNFYAQHREELAPLLDKEQLTFEEARVFSEWRHYLAELVKEHSLVLTPYEKNLEYWRQLWRTIERSDLVLEIVDARNPLLFRSQALEDMIRSLGKEVTLCANKMDYLSDKQASQWLSYIHEELHLPDPVFYSSMRELIKLDPTTHSDHQFLSINAFESSSQVLDVDALTNLLRAKAETAIAKKRERQKKAEEAYAILLKRFEQCSAGYLGHLYNELRSQAADMIDSEHEPREIKSISPDAFLAALIGHKPDPNTHLQYVVGTVGFPNVGKSSLINSLMRGIARVGVSRTPGKTRHLQTLNVPDSDIVLCDCPGLVFPTASASKEDLVINGVMNADTYRGSMVNTVRSLLLRIPAQIGEVYSVAAEILDLGAGVAERPRDVLQLLATQRGYFTAGKGGLPDVEKMARVLVKQYIDGHTLSFCEVPPTVEDSKEWLAEEQRKWEVKRMLLVVKNETS